MPYSPYHFLEAIPRFLRARPAPVGNLSKEERTQTSDPFPRARALDSLWTFLSRIAAGIQDQVVERLPFKALQVGSGSGHRAGGGLLGSEGTQNPAPVVLQEDVDPQGDQFQAQTDGSWRIRPSRLLDREGDRPILQLFFDRDDRASRQVATYREKPVA